MKPFNINYKKAYSIYRMLPLISAGVTLVGSFILGILDAIEYITDIGDLGVLSVLIWLIIGAVIAAIEFGIMTLMMSPTIVKADALLELAEKQNKNQNQAQDSFDYQA